MIYTSAIESLIQDATDDIDRHCHGLPRCEVEEVVRRELRGYRVGMGSEPYWRAVDEVERLIELRKPVAPEPSKWRFGKYRRRHAR